MFPFNYENTWYSVLCVHYIHATFNKKYNENNFVHYKQITLSTDPKTYKKKRRRFIRTAEHRVYARKKSEFDICYRRAHSNIDISSAMKYSAVVYRLNSRRRTNNMPDKHDTPESVNLVKSAKDVRKWLPPRPR